MGWRLRGEPRRTLIRGGALRLRRSCTRFARLCGVHVEQEVAGGDQVSLLDVERHPPPRRLEEAATLDVLVHACMRACVHACMYVCMSARAWMGVRSRLEARWITLAASTLGDEARWLRLGWPALSLSRAQLSSHNGRAARITLRYANSRALGGWPVLVSKERALKTSCSSRTSASFCSQYWRLSLSTPSPRR